MAKPMPSRLLVVDQDARYGEWLKHHLGVLLPEATVSVLNRSEFERWSEELSGRDCDVLLLGASFGSSPEDPQAHGLEMLRQLRERTHFPAVIAVAEDGNELTAVRAMQLGAVDYLPKRLLTPDRLKTSVRLALRMIEKRVARRIASLSFTSDSQSEPGGKSGKAKKSAARAAAPTAAVEDAKTDESREVMVAELERDSAAEAKQNGTQESEHQSPLDAASESASAPASESAAKSASESGESESESESTPVSDSGSESDTTPTTPSAPIESSTPSPSQSAPATATSESARIATRDKTQDSAAEAARDASRESARARLTRSVSEPQSIVPTAAAKAPGGEFMPANFIPGYTIHATIGESEKAAVYVATSAALGENVALKVSKTLRDEAAGRQFLEREYTAIVAIRDPSVVQIYDYGVHAGYEYLVMEYLPRGDLKARMQQALTEQEALRYVAQIAAALQVVHHAGLLHRDLKPPNVMLRESGDVALIDFGLARALDGSTPSTRTGVLRGSPYYMSPEQALGEVLDARSDFYSLGVIFYEMLTGKKPYTGGSAMDVLQQHVNSPVPMLPKVLAHHEPVLHKLMAKSREDRFATAEEILVALADRRPASAPAAVPEARQVEISAA